MPVIQLTCMVCACQFEREVGEESKNKTHGLCSKHMTRFRLGDIAIIAVDEKASQPVGFEMDPAKIVRTGDALYLPRFMLDSPEAHIPRDMPVVYTTADMLANLRKSLENDPETLRVAEIDYELPESLRIDNVLPWPTAEAVAQVVVFEVKKGD